MERLAACLLVFIAVNALVVTGKFCHKGLHLKLDGEVEHLANGELLHNGTIYPNQTFWKNGADYWGCPCNFKQCIRTCIEEKLRRQNMSLPDEKFKVDIFHNNSLKSVDFHQHFFVMKEARHCNATFLLEPEEIESDEFHLLPNGSLFFPKMEEGMEHLVVQGSETYCVATSNDSTELKILMCHEETPDKGLGIQFYLYPVFMITSIIFLIMTLIAFCISPEMHNLHGKSIACQSGTLMLAFVGFTVNYLAGSEIAVVACKIFAYSAFFFMLSSFYWLNTMCFDIFWTFSDFKKMTGSLNQTHKKKFFMYAMYSTINPLILSISMIIMDNVLTEKSSMWPGIGDKKCWFRNFKTEFLYFQGPLLFLLLGNTIFFTMTLIKILRMKKEAQVLKRGDSKTHNSGNGGMEDKQRLTLYVKLFLLMGGTWIMELLSWAIGGSNWIWIITDVINCSRGVLIFVFCVWFNPKVRKSLIRRMSTSRGSHDVSTRESKSVTSKASAYSDVSDSNTDSLMRPRSELDTAV